MSMTLNGTSGLTFNDATTQNTSAFYGGLAFRNRIINGSCMIDQRNAGASVTPTDTSASVFTLDRWAVRITQASKFSIQQSTTVPAGFKNSIAITSASAYSVSSTDFFNLIQKIEGLNVADLGWGSADAQAVTLSFKVRSSLTGTFGGVIHNNAFDRSYPFTYTISSANTYETKTITIAGDTTGTWLTDNGAGLIINFSLGAGSSVSGTAGSWSSTGYRSATGATSVVGTNGATFYITGVQLEKGSTATSFDYRPYGTELALCQRYCYVWGGDVSTQRVGYGFPDSANRGECLLTYPVPMRANPTITFSSTLSDFKVTYFSGGSATTVSPTATNATEMSTLNSRMYWATGSSFAVGTPTALSGGSNTNARIYVSAEL